MTPAAWPIYDCYKSDVAPWLGRVPTEWRFEKAKWFLKHRKQLNSAGTIDNVLSLTLRGVVNNDPDNPEGLVPKDYRTYQIFEAEDLVFKLIDLENVRTSRVGLVHERGIMSSAYIRIVPPRSWNTRFLYYYYFHLYEAEVFNKIGSGVRSTLGQSDLLDLPIPVIDRHTQDKVVQLLDEKCAKVDEAVRIKEEQIALLRERRQILIQEAVTRGLNPDAPMKDSGIDWVGSIPAHWKTLPLKFIARLKSGDTISSERFTAEGFPVFGGNGFRGFTDKYTHEGDFVLIGRQGALCGNVNYASGRFFASEHAIVASPLAPTNTFWLGEIIRTANLNRLSQSAAQPGLSVEVIGNQEFPFAPYTEQVDIGNYVDKVTKKFDDGIALKLGQITALKEYKTTLINAAVTGKIKVA